jgi:hypothetical protein
MRQGWVIGGRYDEKGMLRWIDLLCEWGVLRVISEYTFWLELC